MFRFATDQVFSGRSTSCQSENSEITRLGPAAGENNFVGFGLKKPGNFVARIVDRGACLASRCVNTRGISKMPVEIGEHHSACVIAHRRGGIVIEVNHRGWTFILLLLLLMLLLEIRGAPSGRALPKDLRGAQKFVLGFIR